MLCNNQPIMLPQRQTLLSDFSLVPCIKQAEITLQTALVDDLKRIEASVTQK